MVLFLLENGVYVLLSYLPCVDYCFQRHLLRNASLVNKNLVKKNWKCHFTEPAACQLSTVTPGKCTGTNYFYNTYTLQTLLLPTFQTCPKITLCLRNKECVMRLVFPFDSLFVPLCITGSFVKNTNKRIGMTKKVGIGPEISTSLEVVPKTTEKDTV